MGFPRLCHQDWSCSPLAAPFSACFCTVFIARRGQTSPGAAMSGVLQETPCSRRPSRPGREKITVLCYEQTSLGWR